MKKEEIMKQLELKSTSSLAYGLERLSQNEVIREHIFKVIELYDLEMLEEFLEAVEKS